MNAHCRQQAFPQSSRNLLEHLAFDQGIALSLAQLFELFHHLLAFPFRQPIDFDLEIIIMLGKSTGFPRGKFQDRRPAHSTVRNQERTALMFALGQDPYARLLHGKTRQARNPRILNVQGKKRWNQRLDPMPQSFDQTVQTGPLQGTRSHTYFVERLPSFLPRIDEPSTFLRRLDSRDATLEPNLDTQFAGFPPKTIHNGLGRIGDRKHTAVRFGLGFHTRFSEPFDGVPGLPMMKSTPQFFAPSRIPFGQLCRLETRMSHIATPSPRNLHFTQNLFPRLKEDHFRRWIEFGR